MNTEDLFAKLRIKCHDKAFHVFGHSYIFDKRARKYSKRINLLKVFGVLVPALVGSTALAYGFDNRVLKLLITVAIPVTITQFVFSIFAIIYKWDDELSYSFEASQDYNSIYRRFKKLADIPPSDFEQLNISFDLLDSEFNSRGQQDTKHDVHEKELRRGMRYSLREHQRACVGCKMIPTSMKSSQCDVCGNF